jgi:hypothetical protein
MKHFALAALAAALTGCASAPTATAGSLVDVAVIDRTTGQRIAVHRHRGKHYVAGTPGRKYSVFVANRTSARVMAVVSVDGINVVTGETAAASQSGYVLAPHQSFEVNGWRKSMSEVAAFYFTALPDSYAARTDRPDNVGVIGVAVFREWETPRSAIAPPRSPPWSPHPFQENGSEPHAQGGTPGDAPPSPQSADAAESAGASSEMGKRADVRREREEKLGTGHGAREWSAVRYTGFRRASSYPAETITIHYDSYRNLVARGVIRRAPPAAGPDPFPGGRFAPDPWG